MSESTPIRKSRHVVPEPHAGRYAVFDWLPQGRRRCRLCGARVRKDNAWKHYVDKLVRSGWDRAFLERAIRHGGVIRDGFLESRIVFLLRARRSRRNRRHAQYQYATGGEPWTKDR